MTTNDLFTKIHSIMCSRKTIAESGSAAAVSQEIAVFVMKEYVRMEKRIRELEDHISNNAQASCCNNDDYGGMIKHFRDD